MAALQIGSCSLEKAVGVAFADAVGVRPIRYVAGAEQIACRKRVVVLSAWHVHVASCLIGQGCKGSCGLGPPRDIWLCWGWLAGDSDGLTNEPTSRVRLTRSCSLSRHSFFFWSIHYCTTTATNIDERPGGRTDKAHSSCPACLANMAPCDQHQSSTSSRGLLACLADPPPGWR